MEYWHKQLKERSRSAEAVVAPLLQSYLASPEYRGCLQENRLVRAFTNSCGEALSRCQKDLEQITPMIPPIREAARFLVSAMHDYIIEENLAPETEADLREAAEYLKFFATDYTIKYGYPKVFHPSPDRSTRKNAEFCRDELQKALEVTRFY